MAIIDKTSPASVRQLEGKTVVVVGGSSGIGFAVAQAAVEHGARVVIASSTQAKVDAAVQRLRAIEGVSSKPVSGSAVNARDEKVLEGFWNGIGKLDHMVWTAGDFPPDFVNTTSTNASRGTFDVRFWASVFSAKYLATSGLVNPGGSITLTSGVNTEKPSPGWYMAAAVGGATNAVTRGLAVDLAPIRVNCVSPGAIETELFDTLFQSAPSQKDAAIQMYSDRTLVKHIGTPQESAEAYLFCMKCGFYTGQTLHVEGGALLV